MADPLSKDHIDECLQELPEWDFEKDKLKREFQFENFREAVSFLVRVSYEAEEQVHHPEIFNVYNTVNISLTTHDAGDKVTEKDISLAKTIESLFNN